MQRSSQTSTSIVIDSNLAVYAVLVSPLQQRIVTLFRAWKSEGRELAAPELLLNEAVSAIHRTASAGKIPAKQAAIALDDMMDLRIRTAPSDKELCQAALVWAVKMGQSNAYDAFYLALAERLGAELWTADRKLAEGARRAGAAWVHLVGEEQTAS